MMMEKRNIIVIGASAGGFDAIKILVAGLPANLDAAVLIVWHVAPDIHGILPQALNRLNTLPAAHAVDMEPIKPGRIYVAPPDHHLLVDDGNARISRGPKENRFRPAVDPLFRSASLAYGPRVIGVILSGALDDGAAGLWTIKERGGIAVVQDPSDAAVASMPENALQAVKADYTVPVSEMAALLTQLAGMQVASDSNKPTGTSDRKAQMEVSIAMENAALKFDVLKDGELTPYTCPECHGVLASFREGGRVRFRCHTGHAFSADSLLTSITEGIENGLWSAIRNMQESIHLLNHMGDHFAESNQPKLAAMYFKKAKDTESRAQIVRKAVWGNERMNADSLRHQAEQADSDKTST